MCIVFLFQFVIGDFQVVSDTNPIETSGNLHKVKIIANKAEKFDHLCIDDREYYLLKNEAVAVGEYKKLSLSSENTDDSHTPLLSLNHCNDSLLTTVSDESECATAVHVYNLSKRETKILRHDIIKRSRFPIGGDLKDPFDSLGNYSTNDYNSQDGSTSVLGLTIKDFNNCVTEAIKTDEIKSIRSTVQLKSVDLNHGPHKLDMDNVQTIKNALGTSLDAKDVNELLLNDKHGQLMSENIEIDTTASSKKLIESERNNVCVESHYDAQKTHDDTAYETYLSEKFEQLKDNDYNLSSKQSKADCALSIDPIDDESIEVFDASDLSQDISFKIPIEEIHPVKHVQDYEHIASDIMVKVSEHKEKSVIEENVISFLPSVKALAQTFSQHVNKDVSKQLHHPKVKVMTKEYFH